MMIGHHYVLFYYTAIYYLPGILFSLALYPHNVNKFVLIVSYLYVAIVISQQYAVTTPVVPALKKYCAYGFLNLV
jgi:hypothetical protein